MVNYRTTQIMKQLQFNNGLSGALFLLFLLLSLDFSPFAIQLPLFIFAIVHLVLSVLHFLTFRLLKQGKLDPEKPSGLYRLLAILLLAGLLVGNVFTYLSGAFMLKKDLSVGFRYALYAVIVDLLVIAITSLNFFKPFVSNNFMLMMGLLLASLVLHIFILLIGHKWFNWSKGFKWATLALLSLTALTGNILALFIAVSFYQTDKDRAGERRQTSVREKLTQNQAALLGLTFITFLITIAMTSSWSFSLSFATQNNYQNILQVPSLTYPFGTDNYGRDVFTRIIFGARISLSIGFLSTLLPLFIGGALGAISGYFGSRTDNVIMRLLDVLYAIPGMLLAITIVASFGATTTNLIIALSLGSIPSYARTMRANVMQVANYEYVEAARALGQNDWTIILRHIIPNAMAPMIVRSTLTIGTAVISTSSLSYLGLGVEAHVPEWGNILRIGSQYLETNPYLAIYPGLAIILLVLSFNFLGDGLRDATDPRLN